MLEERRRLERQVADLQRKLATGGGGAEVEEVNGVKLAARNLGEVPARDLKGLADAIGKQIGSGVVALVSTAEGKASIVVGVSQDLTGRFNAVELVRAASAAVGGKGGGGRPDMAQAGGPDGAQADAALAAVRRCSGGVGDCGRRPSSEQWMIQRFNLLHRLFDLAGRARVSTRGARLQLAVGGGAFAIIPVPRRTPSPDGGRVWRRLPDVMDPIRIHHGEKRT